MGYIHIRKGRVIILKLFAEITMSQKKFLTQMLFTTAFITLTSGVFLSGLAVYMGAGDVLVSYISVITNVCGIFVMLFASLLSRAGSQKKLTVGLTVVSRLFTLSVALIPLFVEKQYQLYFFVPIILAAFTLQGLAAIALNNWLAFYTPDKKRGQYISMRQTISLIVSVILSIAAGRYLDSSQNQYYGFAFLFLIAFVMSAVETVVLSRIDDTCIVTETAEKQKWKEVFAEAVRNKTFIRYVLKVSLFYLMLYISDSFTFVFMFRYLELPYTTITVLQMLLTLPQIFMLGIWGKISDKYGHKYVLNRSIWIFAGETVFMLMTSKSNWMICIPIAFMISAIANSGFIISAFNRRYEMIPERGRMLYDSFYNAAISMAFIAGPFLGGVLQKVVLSNQGLRGSMQFPEIRLLYAVSTVGILGIQIFSRLRRK